MMERITVPISILPPRKILKEEEKANRGDSTRGSRTTDNNQYHTIKVKCQNIEVVASVQETIKSMGFSSLQFN